MQPGGSNRPQANHPPGQPQNLKQQFYHQQPANYKGARPNFPGPGAPGQQFSRPGMSSGSQQPSQPHLHQNSYNTPTGAAHHFAKPSLPSGHKIHQSPGLPHEYQSPQTLVQVSGSKSSGVQGIGQTSSFANSSSRQSMLPGANSMQPHSMMPSSSNQSAGKAYGAGNSSQYKIDYPAQGGAQPNSASRSKSPRDAQQPDELHQPFNVSSQKPSIAQANPSQVVPQQNYPATSASQSFYANAPSAPPSQYPGAKPGMAGTYPSPYGMYPAPPQGSQMHPHMMMPHQRYNKGSMPPQRMGYGPPMEQDHMQHRHHPQQYVQQKTNMIAVASFIDEEQRRDYYQKQGLSEVPPFSTLNADVIPQESFVGQLEKHMPKIDSDLIKDIWRTIGVQSSDERVFKVASAMMEMQMLKIVSELKMITAQNQNAGSGSAKDGQPKMNHISFEDLSKTMEEFDVVLRRPQFIEEKQLTGPTASTQHPRPGNAYAHLHSDPSKRFHGAEQHKSLASKPSN